MTFKSGQMVEYERQAGKPPVIARVIAEGDATTTVSPLFVLGDDNAVVFELRGASVLQVDSSLLKPARKICG